MLNRLSLLCFWLLLFLLPTQVGFHFWPDFAFIFGIKVDYLAPTIYLTDLLLVALLILSSAKFLKKRFFWISAPVFIFALVNIFSSLNPIVAVLKWVKVLELSLFCLWVFSNQKLIWRKETARVLLFSILFFSLVGLGQFVSQKTLGGGFYWLGEREFTRQTPGIGLVSLFGRDFLRVYSTFPHPNSFSGFLVVAWLIISSQIKKRKELILFIPVLITFILTFSLGAYLGLFLLTLSYLFLRKKKLVLFLVVLFSLTLPVVASAAEPFFHLFDQSLKERLIQAVVAGDVIAASPLVGVGLNNFFQASHSLQPVHNFFLLLMSEAGVVGLVLMILVFLAAFKNQNLFFNLALIFILITGFFDHYWLTIQQNQLLLAYLLGLSFSKRNV